MSEAARHRFQQIALLVGLALSAVTFLIYFIQIPWIFFGYVPWLFPWLLLFSPIGQMSLAFISYLLVIVSAILFQWRGVPLAFALGMSTGVVATSWFEKVILPTTFNIQRPEHEEAE